MFKRKRKYFTIGLPLMLLLLTSGKNVAQTGDSYIDQLYLWNRQLVIRNLSVNLIEKDRPLVITGQYVSELEGECKILLYEQQTEDVKSIRLLSPFTSRILEKDKLYPLYFYIPANTFYKKTRFHLVIYNVLEKTKSRALLFDVNVIDNQTHTIDLNTPAHKRIIKPKSRVTTTSANGTLIYVQEEISLLNYHGKRHIPVYRYLDLENYHILYSGPKFEYINATLLIHNASHFMRSLPTAMPGTVYIPCTLQANNQNVVNIIPKPMYLHPLTWGLSLTRSSAFSEPTQRIFMPKNTFDQGKETRATLQIVGFGANKITLNIETLYTFSKPIVGDIQNGVVHITTSRLPILEVGTTLEEVKTNA